MDELRRPTPPGDTRPEKHVDYKSWRIWDLHDRGHDIRERPDDYQYIEYKNNGKVDRDFYHIPTLKKVGELAVKRGISPWRAMQIAAAESHGGIIGGGQLNPMHAGAVWDKKIDKELKGDYDEYNAVLKNAELFDEVIQEAEPENRKNINQIWSKLDENLYKNPQDAKAKYHGRIQEVNVNAALDQYEYATKRFGKGAAGIQAYSGTKARPKDAYYEQYETDRMFGKGKGEINMWRDKLQAKRVFALEPHIKNIPALKEAFPEE